MSQKKLEEIKTIEEVIKNFSRKDDRYVEYPTLLDFQEALKQKGLPSSERTVNRVIQELKTMGVPIKFDPQVQGYRFTQEGYSIDKNVMSKQNQLRLVGHLRELLGTIQTGPMYEEATKLLGEMEGIISRQYQSDYISRNEKNTVVSEEDKVIFLGASTVQTDRDLWNRLFDAIKCRQNIIFEYESKNHKENMTHGFAPYQLIYDSGNWNVYGFDYKMKDTRLFNLIHIKSMKLATGNKWEYEIPDDFDFRNKTPGYFGCFETSVFLRYKIKLTGYAKRFCEVRTWGTDQTIESDSENPNAIILSFTSNQNGFGVNSGNGPIMTWILGWGAEAVPLEPKEFAEAWKEKVQETFNTMCKLV